MKPPQRTIISLLLKERLFKVLGTHSLNERDKIMTLTTKNNPFMLGFDSLERILERAAKSSEAYPPYNIERLDENKLEITLAVAGFSEKDLSVDIEDNQLIIRGKQNEEEMAKRDFLYRGIASRQFQRSFVLADGIEVVGAELTDGLLHIRLLQKDPEKKVRRIEIKQLKKHTD